MRRFCEIGTIAADKAAAHWRPALCPNWLPCPNTSWRSAAAPIRWALNSPTLILPEMAWRAESRLKAGLFGFSFGPTGWAGLTAAAVSRRPPDHRRFRWWVDTKHSARQVNSTAAQAWVGKPKSNRPKAPQSLNQPQLPRLDSSTKPPSPATTP